LGFYLTAYCSFRAGEPFQQIQIIKVGLFLLLNFMVNLSTDCKSILKDFKEFYKTGLHIIF